MRAPQRSGKIGVIRDGNHKALQRVTDSIDGTEIGDGGLTDWTRQLTANSKERLLTSGLGVERLARMPG